MGGRRRRGRPFKRAVVLAPSHRAWIENRLVAPEQDWDLATTLTHLSLKAGLPADAWRSGASFETFRAEVFHE